MVYIIPLCLDADGRIASTAAVGEEVLNLQLPGAQHLIPAGGVAEAEVTVAGVVRVEHAPATPLSCQQLVILYLVEDVSFVEIHHILQMSALIEECDRRSSSFWCHLSRLVAASDVGEKRFLVPLTHEVLAPKLVNTSMFCSIYCQKRFIYIKAYCQIMLDSMSNAHTLR